MLKKSHGCTNQRYREVTTTNASQPRPGMHLSSSSFLLSSSSLVLLSLLFSASPPLFFLFCFFFQASSSSPSSLVLLSLILSVSTLYQALMLGFFKSPIKMTSIWAIFKEKMGSKECHFDIFYKTTSKQRCFGHKRRKR